MRAQPYLAAGGTSSVGHRLLFKQEHTMEDRATARIAGFSLAGIYFTCMLLAALSM
jgi:hypothetical protein